jgi:hypothetical protein
MTTDPILSRYLQLSRVQNIPDLKAYGASWLDLADLALQAVPPREHSAEAYRKRGEWYIEQGKGEAVRIIEGSFSELIMVDPPKDYVIGEGGLG